MAGHDLKDMTRPKAGTRPQAAEPVLPAFPSSHAALDALDAAGTAGCAHPIPCDERRPEPHRGARPHAGQRSRRRSPSPGRRVDAVSDAAPTVCG